VIELFRSYLASLLNDAVVDFAARCVVVALKGKYLFVPINQQPTQKTLKLADW
jgi:hypothetical protein